jgi:ElaB/YqjD/DUF883 family membrane-anchored ribosome-binding protein
MEASPLPMTEKEIDSELKEVQAKLQEILESSSYEPKNAKDFELLEQTLQSLTHKQADLIAAKKNMQRARERRS